MPVLDCGHPAGAPAGRVCKHLLKVPATRYHQRFTGRGRAFDLVCEACASAGRADALRAACAGCWARVQADGSWTGITGEPEVGDRPTGLHFRHRAMSVPELHAADVLDVQPVRAADQDLWVALTRDGRVVRLDLEAGIVTPLGRVPPDVFTLGGPFNLHLSAAGDLGAIVQMRGTTGCVLDLATRQPTMFLQRGDYHPEHCPFPCAFAEVGGRTLLVHATDWNRLNVSDPRTGELLTARVLVEASADGRPEHDLDYFHGRLTVSPTGEHVADDGWVWHPVGVVSTWSLRRWLADNPWESEDGPTRKDLCSRFYFWDSAVCWVGTDRLAVWGYGQDADWLRPAVRLFDVTTGAETDWFPGPAGELAFDGVLFASDPAAGTAVWDVETGDRLHADPGLRPRRYHPGRKAFLSFSDDGRYTVSRLAGRPVDPRWRTGDVIGLARAVAEDGPAGRLPLLADALMDAGCEDEEVLDHCRRPGPHGRGCWVADLLLDAG